MKRIRLILVFLLFSLAGLVSAQCPWNNTLVGTALTPTCPGSITTPGLTAGQYCQVNVISGNLYTFSTCGQVCNSYLTLYTSGGGSMLNFNDDNCGITLQSSFTWTATFTGVVDILLDRAAACNSGGGCVGIAVTITCSAPITNDDPCTATALTVNSSCSYSSFSNTGATNTAGVTAPGCASYNGSDVWFSVTVPASGRLIVDTDDGTLTDIGMAFYSGTLCSALTLVECDDDDSQNGTMAMLCWAGSVCNVGNCNLNGTLTPGETIWIRVWDYSGNDVGTFSICAYEPASGTCASYLGTGLNSVASLPFSATSTTCGAANDITSSNSVSCGSTLYQSGEDVVYTFTPTVTGVCTITITSSGSYVGATLFSGCPMSCVIPSGSCVAYSQSSSGNQSMTPCVTAGVTYYLVIDSWSTPFCNPFTVNISAPVAPCPTAPIQDCLGGQVICNDSQVPGNASGAGNTSDLNSGNDGCMFGENQSSWYFFTPQTAGNIALGITPATNIDYDFAIWGPYAAGSLPGTICPPSSSPIRCSYASGASTFLATGSYVTGIGNATYSSPQFDVPTVSYTDAALDGWVTGLTVTAGQVYAMVIDNFTADGTPFTLDWTLSGGATLNCTPLATELLYFSGSAFHDGNHLEWQTASENGLQYFVLERSANGKTFEEVSRMNAIGGNSNIRMGYASIDSKPFQSITYYRLKMVDTDGKNEYSNVIVINSKVITPFTINRLFPNPAENTVTVDLFGNDDQNIQLEILDLQGRIVYSSNHSITKGAQQINVSTSSLADGVYQLRIISGDAPGATMKLMIAR